MPTGSLQPRSWLHFEQLNHLDTLKFYSITAYNAAMKTLALFCLLALPALAADTTIIGNVVGVHDGDTL